MPLPYRDEKTLARLVKYLHRPRSVAEIEDRFGVPNRTVYRWLTYIAEDYDLVRRRIEDGVTYSVLDTDC